MLKDFSRSMRPFSRSNFHMVIRPRYFSLYSDNRRILPAQRRGVLGALDDVLGVGGDKGRAVVADDVGVLDDLLGLEVAQIDHGDAGAGLVVDEQQLAVVVAGRLAQRGVMGVAHANRLAIHVAAVQHVLGAQVADSRSPARTSGVKTAMFLRMRIEGTPTTITLPEWPPDMKVKYSSHLPLGT